MGHVKRRAITHLDNRKPCCTSHETGEGPGRVPTSIGLKDFWLPYRSDIPEHTVARLVDFPSPDDRHVTLDGRFKEIPLAVEFPNLFRRALDDDRLFLSLLFGRQKTRDTTRLDECSGSGWGVDGWYTCAASSKALGDGTLGSKFEGDFA